MGLLIDGVWRDQWYDTAATGGRFVRPRTSFRNWVTRDGAAGPTGVAGFAAAPGRYHLYVSLACPWAHRTLIMRALKGLENLVSVSVVHWRMLDRGWTFEAGPGVIADPVRHSISPAVHNRSFQSKRLDAVYLPFLVKPPQLKDFFAFAGKLPLAGFSVTIPHKQKVIRYLDAVDPLARRIGAVNTVWRKAGKWRGANTDVAGVIVPLKKKLNIAKSSVLIVGNGGAIYNDGNDFRLFIAGTTMTDNHANEGGGAIFYVSNDRSGTLEITWSTLRRNPSDGFETIPGIFFLGRKRTISHSIVR